MFGCLHPTLDNSSFIDHQMIHALRPGQNDDYYADDMFKIIFWIKKELHFELDIQSNL